MSLVEVRRALARRKPPSIEVVAASIFLGVLVLAALVPGLLAPTDPLAAEISEAREAPSLQHPFGTDQSGRDVFARVVHGARLSLLVGFGASALALIAGALIGLISGLAPKPVDSVIGRFIAIAMAFPEFLVALLIIAITGPGVGSLVVAIALAATPAYARVARSQTRTVAASKHVAAARALGVPRLAIVVRHVIPHIVSPLLVMATIGVGFAVVSSAGLSFLGLGPEAPTPEWGVILSEGRNLLGQAPWVALFPGVIITLTVISTSVVGRALRGAK